MRIFGTHDGNTLAQMREVDNAGAVRTALMADAHYGFGMPVGGVAAYRNAVSPTGVGVDIGCGNCAVKLEHKNGSWPRSELLQLGHDIQDSFALGVGRQNEHPDAPRDHPIFEHDAWCLIPDLVTKRNGKTWGREGLRDRARRQLGSVGSGNHYIEDYILDEGRGGAVESGVWVDRWHALGGRFGNGFCVHRDALCGALIPDSRNPCCAVCLRSLSGPLGHLPRPVQFVGRSTCSGMPKVQSLRGDSSTRRWYGWRD